MAFYKVNSYFAAQRKKVTKLNYAVFFILKIKYLTRRLNVMRIDWKIKRLTLMRN